MELSIVFIIILQIVLFAFSLNHFYKKPFDIGAVLPILFIIFYAFPAWDFYFEWGLFTREIQYYRVGYEYEYQGLYLILVTTLIMFIFFVSYVYVNNKNQGIRREYTYTIKKNNFKLLNMIFIFLWIAVLIYSFNSYDNSILLFFSPSRKEDIFDSGVISTLFTDLPLGLFILNILNDYIEKKQLRKRSFFFLIFSLLAIMVTGQRRKIINLFIFTFTLLLHVKLLTRNHLSFKKKNKIKRKNLMRLGLIAVILIPVLWWGRVISTQLQRGSTNIIMPWHRRGFLELLFGSSSGGFITLLMALDHKKYFDLSWGYSLMFLLTSFIPRSIYPDKPIIMNILWQIDFNLPGNASTFFVNEMYLNFGIFSLLFSALFGVLLSYIYSNFYNSKNIINNIFAFLMFSEVITLFKNGFTQFIISILVYFFILGIAFKFTIKTQEVKDGLNE